MLEGAGATPDLTLPDSPYSIVPGNDSRVQTFAQQASNIRHLLDSFKDDQGRSYLPAVLIEDTKAVMQNERWLQAVTAFRNSIAFSHLLINRAKSVGRLNPLFPQWSDTFDLFPIRISTDGHIHKVSPALMAMFHPMESHLATPSPHLHLQNRLMFRPDAYLIRTLGDAWFQHFKRIRKRNLYFIALFRSLEVAYQAASISAKNQASEYDYGIGIVLWVSAIEVLAHQGPGFGVSLESVLDLFEQYDWENRRLRRRSFKNSIWKKDKKRRKRVNAVSAIYLRIYLARNDYLHGNPVSPGKLRPHLGSTRVNLPRAASIVYRIALAAHLGKRYPRLRSEEALFWHPEFMDSFSFEEAMERLISADETNP